MVDRLPGQEVACGKAGVPGTDDDRGDTLDDCGPF